MRALALVLVLCWLPPSALAACGPTSRFVVVIHGGAGNWGTMPETVSAAYESHARDALMAAHAVLSAGGSGVDAVQAAIELMENRGLLNAGKGAVKTSEGIVELDASVMDGKSGLAGAVGAVRTLKNPIRAARRVLERTPHVLLVGEGAERFAAKHGVDVVGPEYFQEVKPVAFAGPDPRYGTVGAVALDCDGNLAAGTSTGGLSGKLPGRLGDSPLIGAGTYASNATCAVSGTGTGEFFIRAAAAYDVSARMAYLGQPLEAAVEASLTKLGPPGTGGLIAVDRAGNVSTQFNTKGMLRGWVREDGKAEARIH